MKVCVYYGQHNCHLGPQEKENLSVTLHRVVLNGQPWPTVEKTADVLWISWSSTTTDTSCVYIFFSILFFLFRGS